MPTEIPQNLIPEITSIEYHTTETGKEIPILTVTKIEGGLIEKLTWEGIIKIDYVARCIAEEQLQTLLETGTDRGVDANLIHITFSREEDLLHTRVFQVEDPDFMRYLYDRQSRGNNDIVVFYPENELEYQSGLGRGVHKFVNLRQDAVALILRQSEL